MRLPLSIGFLATGIVMVVPFHVCITKCTNAQPGQKVQWADIDENDVEDKARFALRPGNFAVLTSIVEFLDGMYAVQPKCRSCTFPFFYQSKQFLSGADFDKYAEQSIRSRDLPSNPLRDYIINIKSIQVYHPEIIDAKSRPQEMASHWDDFEIARKRYPGEGLISVVQSELASISLSRKRENGSFLFYLTFVEGKWRVAWFGK